MSITRRINRIFRPDGRAFIVAFDHGMLDGPATGMEQPGKQPWRKSLRVAQTPS